MARRRREPSPSSIKLKHPDRSGPSEKTLLELAQERGLFDQAKKREEEIGKKAAPIRSPRPRKDDSDDDDDDDDEEDDDDEVGLTPGAERVLETLLWTMSLAMLNFTLDVLVYHQYSVDRISWPTIWQRFAQAFLGEVASSHYWPPPSSSLLGETFANLGALHFQSSVCSSTSSILTPQTPGWSRVCLHGTKLLFDKSFSS
jgi:hypothetical protein